MMRAATSRKRCGPGAQTFDYTYNNRNRMSAVTRNGQKAYATYIYNALEQLVSSQHGSTRRPRRHGALHL